VKTTKNLDQLQNVIFVAVTLSRVTIWLETVIIFSGGSAQKCYLLFRLTDKIPVIFHNLRGYDSHLIMEHIGKFKQPVGLIPNNMEK